MGTPRRQSCSRRARFESARRASLTTSHASSPTAGGNSSVKKLVKQLVEPLHEGVELRHRRAEEGVAELLRDVVETPFASSSSSGDWYSKRLELLHERVAVAREHEVERLRAETHRLLLAGAAADALAQLALEEEAREALARLGDLALDGGGELPGAEEAREHLLEARDELDLDLRSVGGRRRGAWRLAARGLLKRLELGDDRRGDGVELGARLEVRLVVDDRAPVAARRGAAGRCPRATVLARVDMMPSASGAGMPLLSARARGKRRRSRRRLVHGAQSVCSRRA